ncbi:MAG: hypothetical protein AB7Q91_06845 [Phycisphaerales bacterium]
MTTLQTPPHITVVDGNGPGPRDVLVVEEVLLPMLLLPDVSVVLRDVREPISVLQRFLLQAAVDAGVLDLAEAQQASSIPLFALRRTAWAFARAGLFMTHNRPDCFAPNVELCRRSLEMNRVELEKSGKVHLVYLPESDEVLALPVNEHTRKFMAALQSDTPDAGYPMPALEGVACAEFLQQRLDRGEIQGLPSDFLRFVMVSSAPVGHSGESLRPLPAASPAFRVGFVVVSDNDSLHCRLRRLGARRPPEVDFSAAYRLLANTMQHAESAHVFAESVAALRAQGFPAGCPSELVFENPVQASIALEGWVAERVASHGWLTRSYTLRVQHPDLAMTTSATLAFTSADTDADRLFAVDEAARELLRQPAAATPKSLAAAVESVGRAAEAKHVIDRLWDGAEYACVHAIRVQEDLFHA